MEKKILTSGTYFFAKVSSNNNNPYISPLNFMESLLEEGVLELLSDSEIREDIIPKYIDQNKLQIKQIRYTRMFRVMSEDVDIRYPYLEDALEKFEELMQKDLEKIRIYEEIWFENDLLRSEYLLGVGDFPNDQNIPLPINSVTFEGGRMVDTKGNVYLGRDCEDVDEKGFSSIEEVECIINQIDQDRLKGVPLATIKRRSSFLWFIIAKNRKGELANKLAKIEAIEIVNNYRRSLGWSEKQNISEYIDNVMAKRSKS